ncbi:MAG: EamA family transporter [Cyclobacteriaceae bacterium]|nr:EamA family transporter [Cyclobacteriaceae bacterium]MBX2956848.1 EamA family transporter [Cyclobacteriaceae bacterium]
MKRELALAYAALVAVCIIWGTTYLALRIAVLHFPPLLFTAIRQSIAGFLLLAILLAIGQFKLPPKAHLIRMAIGGFLMISMGNGLVAWAEMEIPSGIAAIICSLMPVMVILINLAVNREEKPTWPIVIGVLIGMAGIVTIFSEHVNEFAKTEYQVGIVLILLAVLGWALGSIWIKKQPADSNPFVNAGLQMLFGGLWLFPFSFLFDDLQNVHWSGESLYSLLYLIAFGSIIAYASYLYALKKLPMTIVSLYAYVNPLVAVILGWLILDEKLNTTIGIGILITIGGIYMVNRGYQISRLWKPKTVN